MLLALATVAIVTADPKQPSFAPDVAIVVLWSYLAYSVVLFALVRGEHVRQERVGASRRRRTSSGSASSRSSRNAARAALHAAGVPHLQRVRFAAGLVATVRVTVFLALAYPAMMWVASRIYEDDFVARPRRTSSGPVYLLVIGYLIGYLGEHERRSKRKLGLLLDLTSLVRTHARPGGRSRSSRRALGFFEAQQALLVLRDPRAGRYFTWSVTRRAKHIRVGLRITGERPVRLPVRRPRRRASSRTICGPSRRSALCYDVMTAAISRCAIPPDVPLPGDGAQALLVAPVLIQRTLRGCAVVARETRRKFTRDDLESLLVLVGQAAAGFEAVAPAG